MFALVPGAGSAFSELVKHMLKEKEGEQAHCMHC
jgi:hypothetical protein